MPDLRRASILALAALAGAAGAGSARADVSPRVPVVVSLATPASPARVVELERRVPGLDVERRFPTVDTIAGRVPADGLAALSELDAVRRVHPDVRVRAASDTAREWFGVDAARRDAPWLDGAIGERSLTAAVVDSGIDARSTELDGSRVVASLDCAGPPAGCRPVEAADTYGHGTHIAGTIAGEHVGVAPRARLVSLRVLDETGAGDSSDVIAAIDWVLAHRSEMPVDVINLSLAGGTCSDGADPLSLAADRAFDAGVVVVAAAGNAGPGTCTVGSPGAARGAIAVGAMSDPDDLLSPGFGLAPTSSRGPTADGRVKPDVVAPGVNITSALPCGAAPACDALGGRSGSSMAAAFVSGLALLVLDARPRESPPEVRRVITSTAIDWAFGGARQMPRTSGADADYGAGRLDAYAALRAAGVTGLRAGPPVPGHVATGGRLRRHDAAVDVPVQVTNAAYPLAATLLAVPKRAGRSAALLDLELLDARGARIASDAMDGRQAQVGLLAPEPGAYTLRVTRRSGAGRFVLDVSGGLDPVTTRTPGPSTAPSPPGTGAVAGPADRPALGLTPAQAPAFGCAVDDASQRSLRRALVRGITFRVRCTRPFTARLRLSAGRRSKRTSAAVVARGRTPEMRRTTAVVRIRFPRRAVRRLMARRVVPVRLAGTATDAGGRTAAVRKRLTLTARPRPAPRRAQPRAPHGS